MKKAFAAFCLLSSAAFQCMAQQTPEMKYFTMTHQGLEREYYLYVPEHPAENMPLVIMLHGYSQDAEDYRPEMAQTALKHGFALCVPQGWPAPLTGMKGWNVRYPKQEGMESDDVRFVLDLAALLQEQLGVSPASTFLTGMSNGGEMCYIMAWKHPEAFRAYASVAGLTMAWLPDENRLPDARVPFMEIHGTEDRVSEWTGDPRGEFGWGAYLSVPLAVGNIVAMNKCRYEEVTELPLLDPEAPSRQVILHRFLGGPENSEVRLYEVVGGSHSWHLADIDTCEEIWNFFSLYLPE